MIKNKIIIDVFKNIKKNKFFSNPDKYEINKSRKAWVEYCEKKRKLKTNVKL